MKTLRRLSASLLSVVLFSSIGLAMPISAHAIKGDSASSGSGSSSTTRTDKDTETEIADTTEATSDDSTNSGKTATLRDQFRALAQQDVAAKKAQVKEQTQADRQKVCEVRKAALTKRMDLAVKDAQAHKTYFDDVYAKVKAYQTSKNLTVSDYDSLVATADAAGTDAANSISALQSLDVSVDCTSSTVADSVSAFQQAVKATRDSLKTYRTDILAVITALKAASGSTTSGGSQ